MIFESKAGLSIHRTNRAEIFPVMQVTENLSAK
jgi:hypothetical protein